VELLLGGSVGYADVDAGFKSGDLVESDDSCNPLVELEVYED
jgi:hypothetical protein